VSTTAPNVAPRRLIAARGIVKRFGGETALAEVDFDLHEGEIHALLGENGAGKSTLIKVLAGVVSRDAGVLSVGDGELPHRFRPTEASRVGLAFVHQDLGLCEDLSVSENIALAIGYERRGYLISFKNTESRVARNLAILSVDIDPRRLVGELRQDEKVMVAVTRAFSMHARVVVLDEVSSSLSAPDVRALTDALRASRAGGVGYVYVTHRVDEVFGVADRLTVLRDGRLVVTCATEQTTYEQVVEWIVGAGNIPSTGRRSRRQAPATTSHTERRVSPGRRPDSAGQLCRLPGEIIGVCGLVGCGARELAALLGGAAPPSDGLVELDGEPLPLGASRALRRAGCAYVPGDRQREGAVPKLSIRENLFMARIHPGKGDELVRWPARERRASRALTEQFDVRPREAVDRELATLSGGNQQKVVVGRVLAAGPRLLIADDPTAGVDIGARSQIHGILRAAATAGTIVVLASTDFDEVAALADRALVMVRGGIDAELRGDDLTPDRLVQASYARGDAEPNLETSAP
jgi:ribose transport system ATP-binding protein